MKQPHGCPDSVYTIMKRYDRQFSANSKMKNCILAPRIAWATKKELPNPISFIFREHFFLIHYDI